jgi:hypothetical protein
MKPPEDTDPKPLDSLTRSELEGLLRLCLYEFHYIQFQIQRHMRVEQSGGMIGLVERLEQLFPMEEPTLTLVKETDPSSPES